jgi:hypothetical protein
MTQEQFVNLSEQILIVRREIAALRSSVNALKALVATQISPDQPEEVLGRLQVAESTLAAADSTDQELKKALDTIEALRHWKSDPPPQS